MKEDDNILRNIISWHPFKASYINYEGKRVIHTFTCTKCGSHNAERPKEMKYADCFTLGTFRCADCKAETDGYITLFGEKLKFCFYHPAFTMHEVKPKNEQ